jgi:hypothetical protein
MLDEVSAAKKCVEEVIIDLMVENVTSFEIQASSTRGVKASPSTSHIFRPSQDATKKRTKHRDDLENAKIIPTILPDYIPPLAGVVVGTGVDPGFSSKSAPTRPNYWPFRKHL